MRATGSIMGKYFGPALRGPVPLKLPGTPKRRERVLGELPYMAVRIGRMGDMPTPENVVGIPETG